MNLATATILFVLCGLLYYYFKKKLSYFKDRNIDHIPPVPVLGNMSGVLFRTRHISDIVRDIYKINPEAKYVGAFDFMTPIYVIRDPELIKTLTIKNFDSFPDHRGFVDNTLDPMFGSNLFSMTGDRWREARNLLSPAFTSSKMKTMHELMANCAENFVKYIGERSEKENYNVGIKDLFTKYTNDVIATCAFGISVDTLKNPKNEFYVYGRVATNFEGPMILKFFLARAFPTLMKLFKIKLINDRIQNFFKNIVSSTIKARDEQGISRPDMLQLMMDARGKTSENLKLDITEMTAQAFIFFFGGFDSTSTQMCIIANELAANPDIQEKCQFEIDEILKKSGDKITYDDINSMTYFDAVFYEALRRHPLVSFLDRYCRKGFELPPAVPGGKPVTVEEGSTIWIPVAALHTDENYHEDPYKFNPERFLNKKMPANQIENLGFGIGPRSCIGNRFAILETKILFFYLLSKFNLKPNKKTSIPLKYKKGSFNIIPEGGYWLTIEKRSGL